MSTAVAGGLIVLVTCFGIGMTIMYDQAGREADRNSRPATCLEDLFEFDPREVSGGQVSLREHLERHAGRVLSELDDEPSIQVKLPVTIGLAVALAPIS